MLRNLGERHTSEMPQQNHLSLIAPQSHEAHLQAVQMKFVTESGRRFNGRNFLTLMVSGAYPIIPPAALSLKVPKDISRNSKQPRLESSVFTIRPDAPYHPQIHLLHQVFDVLFRAQHALEKPRQPRPEKANQLVKCFRIEPLGAPDDGGQLPLPIVVFRQLHQVLISR